MCLCVVCCHSCYTTLYIKQKTPCVLRLNATLTSGCICSLSAKPRETIRRPIRPNWALISPNLLSVAEVRPEMPVEVLPKHLRNLFTSIQTKQPSRATILLVVVYAFGLESGFASFGTERINTEESLPTNRWWSTFNSRLAQRFSHNWPDEFLNYDEEYYELPLELIGTQSTSSTLLVHDLGDVIGITLNGGNVGRSVCLNLSKYVTSTQLRRLQHKCLTSLHLLGKLLRNRLYVPVRNGLLDEAGLPFPGLTGVPMEIRLNIYRRLNMCDLHILSKTCTELRNEIRELPRVQKCL